MKKILIKLMMAGLVLGFIASPIVCLAVTTIAAQVDTITSAIVAIGTALVALMIVVAGILFVTSSGDPGKVSLAKACLFWAVIGGIIILARAAFIEFTTPAAG